MIDHACNSVVYALGRALLRCPDRFEYSGNGAEIWLDDIAQKVVAIHSRHIDCRVTLSGYYWNHDLTPDQLEYLEPILVQALEAHWAKKGTEQAVRAVADALDSVA